MDSKDHFKILEGSRKNITSFTSFSFNGVTKYLEKREEIDLLS